MSFLVLIVAAGALGTWALRPLGLGTGLEGTAYRLLTGLCLCAALILVIGSVSLKAAQFVMIAVAAAGLIHDVFVVSRRRVAPFAPAAAPAPFTALEKLSVVAVIGALSLAFVSALAPVTSWEAGVAHLALPAAYAREGRIMVFEGNPYSAFPQFMYALYAYVYSQGGETLAVLVNWTLAALACVSLYTLGRRIENRACGLIAAAILATSPIFMDQAGTVAIDLAFSATATAALGALVAYYDEKKWAWMAVAAFLAGSACGIRHTGYLVCALIGLAVLFGKTQTRPRDVASFALIAALAAAPWLWRSYLLAGNPVYPFLMTWFPATTVPHLDISALGSHGQVTPVSNGSYESIKGTGLGQFLWFPYAIVMKPHLFDGWTQSPGCLVLILGLPGLIVGGGRVRWLGAYSGAGGAGFFFFERFARYLLPFFMPMMIAAGAAACRLPMLRKLIAPLLVFTYAYGLALDAGLMHSKIPAALGLETREEYLTKRIERYPAFRWVNENIPPASVVLTLDRRSYYIKGRTYQNRDALKPLIGKPYEDQLTWLKSRNIKYLLLPEAELAEPPGPAEADLLRLVFSWRNRPHFRLLQSLDLPRPQRPGETERVSIYEVRYGEVYAVEAVVPSAEGSG